jgi:hypothetical protein
LFYNYLDVQAAALREDVAHADAAAHLQRVARGGRGGLDVLR